MDPQSKLTELVRRPPVEQAARGAMIEEIRRALIADRFLLDGENFSRINPQAVERAFDGYDRLFFNGCCRQLLKQLRAPLDFQLSKRMTRAGGMTVRQEQFEETGTQSRFTIKLSSTLLFQSFRDGAEVSVSGCRCTNRLDAMLRIVEHEMIHLIEMLLWYDSSCSQARFQRISHSLFGHTESTHQLLTPIEAARDEFGIVPGDRVRFTFEGRTLSGLVNRITRRATVLVQDPSGERYNDGMRYLKYYVPLRALKKEGVKMGR